ncbi:MAG: ROK family protein [Planctomycetaceae bacterium]|nr:ROK family protein [Planctomycetaceae bacterium]
MSTFRISSQFHVESSVIQKIRYLNRVSRVELSRQLSLAPSTIGIHVDRLMDQGFLRQGHQQESTSGRPATLVELNPDAGQFVGIDLDSRQVHGVSVDFAQRLLRDRTVSVRSNASAENVMDLIESVIEDVKDQSRELLGIGIGVPGTVDIEQGIGVHYQFIKGWRDLPVSKRLQDRFQVPVHLENNIRSMALAERWFGQGKETDNYICLGIRAGIGSGIVLNGELYRGAHHLAGEIGAWRCSSPGDHQSVMLEQVASLEAILQTLTQGVREGKATSLSLSRNRVTLDILSAAVAQADPFACDVLKQAGQLIGQVISQMVLLLDLQKVIIAGPITRLGDVFLLPIRERLKELLPVLHSKEPEVIYSELGDLVGALGAAALAVNVWQPHSR